MTNNIFCVGLTRTELQTLGTLLYSPDGGMCALRDRQSGQPNVRVFCVTPFRPRERLPCAATAAIPADFAAETAC